MEFMRYCRIWAIVIFLPLSKLAAQTVYYPSDASTMLKNTAADMAQLLQSAMQGATINTQVYTSLPATGIVLVYDSSITDNQACYANGNGSNQLILKAAEDNGLIFGVYQYLREMGFLFYQPGDLWNVVPSIQSPFRQVSKIYTGRFKYQTWFISGGHRLWIMDKSTAYNWNGSYIGENGHTWSLFMRRNGMLGKHRYAGHRADILSADYMNTLQNNPCYVASNFGSRVASNSSVPDILNENAKHLWADAIEKKYSQTRNNIFSNPTTYKDLIRAFRYNNEYIGIEVPDGPRWGFGADSLNCNNEPYPSAADQAAILSNYTSAFIRSKNPGKRTQMYAYFTHADIPSGTLHNSIDVQVPTAFQVETSIKNLFKKWYQKHPNVSEYHYLNIPAWTAETPGFGWDGWKQAAERIKQNNGQGIVIEASPAKFASIPLLRANNNNLLYNQALEAEMQKFCTDMFGQAAQAAYDLLMFLGEEQEFLGYKKENQYRLPLLFKKMERVHHLSANENNQVKQRVRELKAYLHYVSLYYDYSFNEKNSAADKSSKAGSLCLYLARCNKLRIVNSYYLINRLVNSHNTDTAFVNQFNSQTGSAYQQGNLPLINEAEIEVNYQQDISKYVGKIPAYEFEKSQAIAQKIQAGAFTASKKIFVEVGYTLGAQYPGKEAYYFYAAAPGQLKLSYNAIFEMPEYGQVNFVVEEATSGTNVIFDSSIRSSQASGNININVPAAGNYCVVLSTKYKTKIDLEIGTSGFAFYKNAAFMGDVRENFSNKPSSFPGSFFVPQGLARVYFSVTNSYNSNSGYLSVTKLENYFIFKDNLGNRVTPKQVTGDSLLYYLEIPGGQSGSFWQFFNTANRFNLCFANISNYYWFGTPKTCSNSDFEIDLVKEGGQCLVRLTAKNFDGTNEWQVFDKNKWVVYHNKKQLILPAGTSPYAVINHLESTNCSTQKSIWDIENYGAMLEACASGASLPQQNEPVAVVAFPNPTTGFAQFKQAGESLLLTEITLYDVTGKKLLTKLNTNSINLEALPPATYFYRLKAAGLQHQGKIQKH